MAVAKTLFWGALGALAWTHVGYPVAAGALARVRERRVAKDPSAEPTVALVVAAYNEEEVIERRLENLLALDYPDDRLELGLRFDAVGADGTPTNDQLGAGLFGRWRLSDR